MIFPPGATSRSLDVQIVDDTGLPVTGLVAATFPAVYWSLAGNTASTAISLSDLAAIATAWASGGVKERDGSAGFYRLDLPNGALANAGSVRVYGEASGKHLICEAITVEAAPLDSTATQAAAAAALTAYAPNTVAPDNAGIGTAAAAAASAAVDAAAIKLKTDLIPASPAAVGSAMTLEAPERSSIAAAWGASVIGHGRTRDFFLQGGINKIEFAADGLSYTIYQTDDTNPLDAGDAGRFPSSVTGLQSITPGA